VYRKIIVGYDDSERAQDALALGELLARISGAELVVAGVFQFDPLLGSRDPSFAEAEADFARAIEQAAATAGATAEAMPSTSVGRGLHELVEELGADLVVVGSSHRSRVGQVLTGNVGTALLHGGPCSVAVAPHGYASRAGERPSEIVVGYDGSDEAQVALDEAIELARASHALLTVVTVAEPPPIVYGKGGGPDQGRHELAQVIEEMMRERLDQAAGRIPADVRSETVMMSGEAGTALAQRAADDSALLMLGSRDYGPLRRVLLGSVATSLLRSAPCPVIVHPRPGRSAAGSDG
jgi:nucleotide-binding universal stress UspA family protein